MMNKNPGTLPNSEGLLLVNKSKGRSSFSLVSTLRRLLNIQKIGHAGTLDPLATGVMVMLIGKSYTRLSNCFLTEEKEYRTTLHLGIETDSFDSEGRVLFQSERVPSQEEVESALKSFQGKVLQIPPMFSAKKIQGKRLYKLARKGIQVDRAPIEISLSTKLLSYTYPEISLEVTCSKGTYIRSIAHDIGALLECGAHLTALERTRSGSFHLSDCIDDTQLIDPTRVFNRLRSM
jgi:tRNA pseudouridine55 synthase